MVWQLHSDDLDPVSPSQFHCRNKIRIASYQKNSVNQARIGIGCNVESNAQIDTLLFKLWLVVVIRWVGRLCVVL